MPACSSARPCGGEIGAHRSCRRMNIAQARMASSSTRRATRPSERSGDLHCGVALFLPADSELDSAPLSQTSSKASRSEEHPSELQSLMRNSYAVFCLKKKNNHLNYST